MDETENNAADSNREGVEPASDSVASRGGNYAENDAQLKRNPFADTEPPVVASLQPERPSVPPAPQAFGNFEKSFAKPSWPNRLGELVATESYGAPRVFDLFTLLAVTVAFALLFGFLKLVEPALDGNLPVIAVGISVFVTLIALAQLTLWGGQLPRLASLVAGPVLWIILLVCVYITSSRRLPDISTILGIILSCICTLPIGILIGYLGGAVVAGVFLIAESLRKLIAPQSLSAESKSVGFDDVD